MVVMVKGLLMVDWFTFSKIIIDKNNNNNNVLPKLHQRVYTNFEVIYVSNIY